MTAAEFRRHWSHKPTPISAESSGLFYSEECTDQLLTAYAAHAHQALYEALSAAVEQMSLASDTLRGFAAMIPSLNEAERKARAALALADAAQEGEAKNG